MINRRTEKKEQIEQGWMLDYTIYLESRQLIRLVARHE